MHTQPLLPLQAVGGGAHMHTQPLLPLQAVGGGAHMHTRTQPLLLLQAVGGGAHMHTRIQPLLLLQAMGGGAVSYITCTHPAASCSIEGDHLQYSMLCSDLPHIARHSCHLC